jgi:hypothetical protein
LGDWGVGAREEFNFKSASFQPLKAIQTMKAIRTFAATLLICTTAMTGSCAVGNSTTADLLQQGLYAEEVEGDLDSAFKIYGRIVRAEGASGNHVAQALYRMAMVSIKTNDQPTARGLLEKLVREHSNQVDLVEKARPFLDDLADLDPAMLMPAGTLAYVEFGSPGSQVEKMLNLLKGTPYENPLAAMATSQGGGAPSAGDLAGALLNPSMLAEFKKVRSSAIGITGLSSNGPSVVVVLSPGKSDALRGLILAGLGVQGTPGETIEGMQTVKMNVGPGINIAVAHDDKVFIAAQPAEQLSWVVKQYKGKTSEPSLATVNKSFAKFGKVERQKNAFTVWANVDEAYGQALKLFAGRIPPELYTANAFVDFSNIDDLTFVESVQANGFASEMDLRFKEGHRCLIYDLIRTPNLGKAPLDAVPPEAVALVSFALSPASSVQAEQVRARIQNITGLDLGREIFANIEQVTLFAMPTRAGSGGVGSAFLPQYLGLAITSRNPAQTRQILSNILGTADTISSGGEQATAGRYRIGKRGEQALYCHMDQVNSTTILAFDRAIVDASIASVKNRRSVGSGGPLHNSISKLEPSTSKLALGNAAGMVRLLAPGFKLPELTPEQEAQLETLLEQLARTLESTTIELRTDEQPNGFALVSSVTGIPPLNEFLAPASQMTRIVNEAKSEAAAKVARQQTPALVFPATKAPVIDGKEDDVWASIPGNRLENVSQSFGSGEKANAPSSPEDLSATYRAMWDENNLYVLVDVTDDKLINDTSDTQPIRVPSGSERIAWWYDDCIEVFIDADNAKPTSYGPLDVHFHFDWDHTQPTAGVLDNHGRMENVEYKTVTTEKGYRTEMRFPWAALGTKPSAGKTIGLDIHVNDDDDGGERDTKMTWRDTSDTAWQNPRAFGNATLGGMVGWWKFDETEGKAAKDSSGGNHNGTLMGNATWTKGKSGGALRLDGRSAFVRISDKSAFDMADQVTVSCWVNVRSVTHDHMAVVTKGDGAWRLSTHQHQPKFHASVNNWQQCNFNSEIKVGIGEWHHVAMVHDGKDVFIYVDGKLDIKGNWEGGIARNGFEVLIGENAENRGRFFDGDIDDVRIYNCALSENEIKALAAP